MLRTRTLTNLYNERPAWLDIAHRTLDHMVFDAYGWPHDLSDEELLARLLALNLERARRPLLRRVNLDKTASGPARNPIGAQQPVIPGLGPYDMGAQSAVPAPSNQIDSQDQKRRA